YATRAAHDREPPDGYDCGGEISALAVLRELERAGKSVGHTVHLVTMETSDLPSLYSTPVPGFFQNLHRAGSILADFHLRRIGGEPVETMQRLDTMVVRDPRRAAEPKEPSA